ncbi:anthranilate synthase component I family protein [Chitinophaga pollutisoli]|uniref:Anthranilate synthase component I family protein n=1 Tax=Chitinophaga pollutisoli TaxID=3133966 RepID=A0ABZ2YIK0_9BACT
MDNNNYSLAGSRAEAILAADAVEILESPAGSAFNKLRRFHDDKPGWLFGHLSYDLKNETEKLGSQHPDGIGFPDLSFFRPRYVLRLSASTLEISGESLSEQEARAIHAELLSQPAISTAPPLPLVSQSRLQRAGYLEAVHALQEHIRKGDCYEVNFCREQYAHARLQDPASVFLRLNGLSPAPFAAYYRRGLRYLACSSPERFLRKEGDRIISQPIKGTIRRAADPAEDAALLQALRNSPKEQSENVMVVDLVRNDLSRTAVRGSVEVSELFGIYSFPQVHHMISTVSATLDPAFHFTDAIRNAFPMGSMTGAPKVKVMQLIEQYEKTRRGLFSGAVGYITPEGDFDFNVVIRSILYSAENHYVSFQTGSAITFYSNPEKEWEECLLKARALRQALGI